MTLQLMAELMGEAYDAQGGKKLPAWAEYISQCRVIRPSDASPSASDGSLSASDGGIFASDEARRPSEASPGRWVGENIAGQSEPMGWATIPRRGGTGRSATRGAAFSGATKSPHGSFLRTRLLPPAGHGRSPRSARTPTQVERVALRSASHSTMGKGV
jgi:hypothetical protein